MVLSRRAVKLRWLLGKQRVIFNKQWRVDMRNGYETSFKKVPRLLLKNVKSWRTYVLIWIEQKLS
ncbi:hypothetical protein PHET_06779 [Paragonimus heterotremus]|uniref:Uncharacterized protein n=1 Tax=Paragonimus heterotremus TaxID=100268 RepID=A0A8J4WQH2_9TREM|nr:hypothetical protein PHET_06779 [Paragonimus heterotremus]